MNTLTHTLRLAPCLSAVLSGCLWIGAEEHDARIDGLTGDDGGLSGDTGWLSDTGAGDSGGGDSGDDTGTGDVDADGDGYDASVDCDDTDEHVHPGADEVCNGLDDDCDGEADEGVALTWYTDSDGDGYGDDATVETGCEVPEGAAAVGGDCDDTDTAYNPGATESDCTDVNDYNCDGAVGYTDGDGDGYAACEECDDGDASIHPGADETCDKVDNDCDGVIDDDPTDPSTFYVDSDGDGYGDPDNLVQACEVSSGIVANDSDCDDGDAAVHPTADEVCDDQDNDCDGLADDADPDVDTSAGRYYYDDGDGDGYGVSGTGTQYCDQPEGTSRTYTDCDDDDDTVHPGATEVCDDGKDNDCDGSAGSCALSGSYDTDDAFGAVIGSDDDQRTGSSVAGAGDINGDGFADMFIGGNEDDSGGTDAGAAFLVFGPLSSSKSVSSAAATLTGADAGDQLGKAVAGGFDWNDDGTPDLLVSAPRTDEAGGDSGSAFVVLGPLTGTAGITSAADVWLTAGSGGDMFGEAVAVAGDVDGDGHDDILVGASEEGTGGGDAGAVYLFMGGGSGLEDVSDAQATFTGNQSEKAGAALAGQVDLDGDGTPDMLVGARHADDLDGDGDGGRVYGVFGPHSGTMSLDDADVVLVGSDGEQAGKSVASAGDLDGDGYDDVLVGASQFDSGSWDRAGAAYVLYGPLTASVALSMADARLKGTADDENVGTAVSGVGDLDQDGLPDFAVGGSGSGAGDNGGGVVYVIYDAPSGTSSLNGADVAISGAAANDQFGASIAAAGDVSGNGPASFLVGAPRADNWETDEGAAYLFWYGW